MYIGRKIRTALTRALALRDELAISLAIWCCRGPGELYVELAREEDEYDDIAPETGIELGSMKSGSIPDADRDAIVRSRPRLGKSSPLAYGELYSCDDSAAAVK